jgi:hypothetical protein
LGRDQSSLRTATTIPSLLPHHKSLKMRHSRTVIVTLNLCALLAPTLAFPMSDSRGIRRGKALVPTSSIKPTGTLVPRPTATPDSAFERYIMHSTTSSTTISPLAATSLDVNTHRSFGPSFLPTSRVSDTQKRGAPRANPSPVHASLHVYPLEPQREKREEGSGVLAEAPALYKHTSEPARHNSQPSSATSKSTHTSSTGEVEKDGGKHRILPRTIADKAMLYRRGHKSFPSDSIVKVASAEKFW